PWVPVVVVHAKEERIRRGPRSAEREREGAANGLHPSDSQRVIGGLRDGAGRCAFLVGLTTARGARGPRGQSPQGPTTTPFAHERKLRPRYVRVQQQLFHSS